MSKKQKTKIFSLHILPFINHNFIALLLLTRKNSLPSLSMLNFSQRAPLAIPLMWLTLKIHWFTSFPFLRAKLSRLSDLEIIRIIFVRVPPADCAYDLTSQSSTNLAITLHRAHSLKDLIGKILIPL